MVAFSVVFVLVCLLQCARLLFLCKNDVTDKSIKSNSHLHPHIYKISEFVFLKPPSYVTKRFNAFLEKRKGIQKGFSDSI